ncbi:hypothetical protein CHUAL_007527 [Chamberlinius hualienensis]
MEEVYKMGFNLKETAVKIVDGPHAVMDVVKELATSSSNEEPFIVCDLSDIVRKHKLWKVSLPRVEPFYAVKCNHNPAVLEILATLGTGFDCASKGEIQKILGMGIDNSRIIYANPCKTPSFMRFAASKQVHLMTFDNVDELHKVKEFCPEAKMVVRIMVAGKARCPLGLKFGIEKEGAFELLNVAKEMGIDVVGVSFHVGSGCEDVQSFHRALKDAREVFDFAEMIGYKFNLLDIGGGYPGSEDSPVSFGDMVTVINKGLDEFFPDGEGVRIIAEPGRFFVASAFTLGVSVIAKREVRSKETEETSFMYYVNDGVYGTFSNTIGDHAVVSGTPLKDMSNKPVSTCTIFGPTCDSFDKIIENILMPELEVGDWLVFKDMGAYSICTASSFNGFQITPLHYIASNSTRLYLQMIRGIEIPARKTGTDVSIEDIFDRLEISVVDI